VHEDKQDNVQRRKIRHEEGHKVQSDSGDVKEYLESERKLNHNMLQNTWRPQLKAFYCKNREFFKQLPKRFQTVQIYKAFQVKNVEM